MTNLMHGTAGRELRQLVEERKIAWGDRVDGAKELADRLDTKTLIGVYRIASREHNTAEGWVALAVIEAAGARGLPKGLMNIMLPGGRGSTTTHECNP